MEASKLGYAFTPTEFMIDHKKKTERSVKYNKDIDTDFYFLFFLDFSVV